MENCAGCYEYLADGEGVFDKDYNNTFCDAKCMVTWALRYDMGLRQEHWDAGRAQIAMEAAAAVADDDSDDDSEEHPAEEHPAEEHPAEEHPAEEHPAEEHPAEEHPAEEHPAEEHPAEEHPAEKHPAEEHPAEEHPAEEHPAEEHPAEEHEWIMTCTICREVMKDEYDNTRIGSVCSQRCYYRALDFIDDIRAEDRGEYRRARAIYYKNKRR
jgi:hypothetical protein